MVSSMVSMIPIVTYGERFLAITVLKFFFQVARLFFSGLFVFLRTPALIFKNKLDEKHKKKNVMPLQEGFLPCMAGG